MNTKNKFTSLLVSLTLIFGSVLIAKNSQKFEEAFATYTNGDAATYYSSIDESKSGNALLTELRSLNLSKRQSTVGYSSMGTSPSGQFKYTDYDPNYVQYDSNGQPYGTRISSFYTFTSATSWNREHVWPNSHGGGSGGDAGSPYPDADIHMPRPTISSENSSRGNSFFVEGMNHSSSGWDPYTAGYSAESRGEAARITFYCTLVNSKLILAPNNTTPSGTDSVTGQSFGSGHTMGNLETLIKWNINYPVNQREKNRNEGAEYLQGNRNPFVDHPEYACKIWGNVNNNIKNMCANASWDIGPSVTISRSNASITVDDTTYISATSSDSSTISWTSSDTTVVELSANSSASGANVTLTAVGPGTATITARATINNTVYSATCSVTVSSSGGSGGGGEEQGDADSYTISTSDLDTSYPKSEKAYTAQSGLAFTAYYTANFSSKVQFKSGSGYIYNNSSLKLGTLTLNDVSGSLTVYAGTTRNPSSTTISGSNGVYDLTGYNYFKIINSSSSVATCSSINVGIASSGSSEKTLSSIEVYTSPSKVTYTAGEYFDPAGLVITRNYSDNTSDTYTYAGHTSEFSFNPTTSTALTTGNTSITISYGNKSCNQAITVNAAPKTLSSISITIAPTKTTYTAGEYFDPTGLVIRRTYSDSTYDTYTYANHTSEFSFTPSTSTALTTGNTSVAITYSGKSCNQAITVNAPVKTLSSISVSVAPSKTEYIIDEYFDPAGLVITRNYSDSTSDTYTYAEHTSEFSFNPSLNTALTTEHTSVTITYEGKTCSVPITVKVSGGGSQVEEGTQRIAASTTSTYYTSGSICPTGSTTSASATCDAFDVSWLKVSGSNNIAYTYDEMRVYSGHSFTITPKNGYTITSVVITANSGGYANAVGGSSLTNCTKNVSGSTVTLTPTDGSSAVGFANSAQSRINYITVNYEYESSSVLPDPTYITATANKTFTVGEIITTSDITVRDSNDKVVSNFSFANNNYQFKYSDASSGGAVTNKTFTNAISYSTFTCDLTVQVNRVAYVTPTASSLTHTGSEFSTAGISSSYTENQAAIVDGISFKVSGYIYNSKLSLSSSKTSAPGSLTNISPYPAGISNVTINGASPDIQLSTDGDSWVDLSNTTPNSVNYFYLKIFYKTTSQSNYVNITDITVSIKGAETASNVANYIMFEDTNNQCEAKLNIAIGYLQNMSSSESEAFQNSSDYVIATARERLEAWATNQGKTINYSTGALQSSINGIGLNLADDVFTTIIIVSSLLTGCAISLIIYLKRKNRIIK